MQQTVAELTHACMQLREKLGLESDQKDRAALVLRHLKSFASRDTRISDFQAGLEWFNVSEDLSVNRHLGGKIVVLDFFTYCCINCMHILPDLHELEKKHTVEDGLVVIGVHSAKFANERESKQLSHAVKRYGISHPVVNDARLSCWRSLGITCWPTLLIVGPAGQPLAILMGEGHRDELFLYVEVALKYFKSLKKISSHNLPLELAGHLSSTSGGDSVLSFPGKVAVFSEGSVDRLVIADSGNNRILVTDSKGQGYEVIGGLEAGFVDGDLRNARFNAPQGVCVLANTIFVADTENHAIRRIDLHTRTVSTLAGTGVQGHDYVGGKTGRNQPLSSPWDVAVYEHDNGGSHVPVLLIANAGTHQIWSIFLEDTTWWKNRKYKAATCAAIVGSGREENRNNSYPHAAGLAQPSGLAIDQKGRAAFFADSESSTVRRVDLGNGRVTAVCGANKDPMDLHNYGDVDGTGYQAKLQHPLGVAWHPLERVVYVADTYNHKIKRVNPTGHCETVYSHEKFNEPCGLAVNTNGDVLYVADTNHHVVKSICLKSGTIVALPITLPAEDSPTAEPMFRFDTTLDANGGDIILTLGVSFEGDLKLNADSPQKWSIVPHLPGREAGWTIEPMTGELSCPISVRVPKGSGTSELYVTLNLIVCKTTECIPKQLTLRYRLHQEPGASSRVVDHRQILVKE